MPCTEIRAEWAAQRIKGLSVASVLMHALRRNGSKPLKTLISEFQYPRLGPGMMWERAQAETERLGARVVFNAPVERIHWRPGAVTSVVAGGREYSGGHFISTMAIRDLIEALDPTPADLLKEVDSFRYRDFLTVALIVEGPSPFPDNWVYVHSPEVQVGRIQNYNNWSPDMVPEPGMTCLGLEYFCFEGDGLWKSPDASLIGLAKREIASLGLIDVSRVVDGAVVRMPKAYPVYDGNYQQGLEAIRAFLREVPNLQLAGRNGMHRYNNQDHSMLTGILAARNILGAHYDLWRINVDAEYHEEGYDLTEEDVAALSTTQPLQPERLKRGR
jgi:protoporphyrinogen oxidase